LEKLTILINDFVYQILGFKSEKLAAGGDENEAFHKAVDLVLQLRSDAKQNKDWAMCDKIRDELKAIGFVVKDTADGAEWKLD
jgi:cysteinyl-tRNA synthetase